MLTKASIYKTQHCFPGRIHSECRSMADLWLYALSKVFASIAPTSSPPLPSNSGEAFAELKDKMQQVSQASKSTEECKINEWASLWKDETFKQHYYACKSNRFFENQANKICSHLSEKASKGSQSADANAH